MPIFCFHFFEKMEQKFVLGKRKETPHPKPLSEGDGLGDCQNQCNHEISVISRYYLTIRFQDEFFTLAHRGRGFV